MDLKRRIRAWLGKQLIACKSEFITAENQKNSLSLKYVGTNVRLNGKVDFRAPENIELHNNVHIGEYSLLEGRGGLVIGENTHISRKFTVHTSSHCYQGRCLPYDDQYTLKPVSIGRNVWIGTHVIVIPGVTIGDGAIIGAGCIVSKNVAPLEIVGSQPFRVLKLRDKEHYCQLDSHKKYGGISGREIF